MLELSISYFDQIYRIMEEAFPKEERRCYDEQKALFEREEYHIYGIVKKSAVQAFIACYEFEDYIFIEHLATHITTRGSGVGKKLLQEYFKRRSKFIVFEVELPHTNIAKRRISFYKRLECHLYSNIVYEQPSFHGTDDHLQLYLMSYRKRINSEKMLEMIQRIYKEVYYL